MDAMPPTNLPAWFIEEDVVLHAEGAHLVGADFRSRSASSHPDLLDHFLDVFLTSSFTDAQLAQSASDLSRTAGYADLVDDQTTKLVAAAAHATAALSTAPEDLDLHELDPQNALGQSTRVFEHLLYRHLGSKKDEAANEGEVLAMSELLRAVRTGLLPPSLGARDARTELRRPVPVAVVLNYGTTPMPRVRIEDIAQWMQADVVHLDAINLAEIAGTYLGQSHYWSRGPFSMIGYDALERSGRSTPRHPSRAGDDDDEYTIRIPRLMSTLSRSPGVLAARLTGKASVATDDRWEELKLNRILEDMVKAVETKRAMHLPTQSASSSASTKSPRRVIVHVRDFVELSLSAEGQQVLNSLRNIVDRLWQKGQQIVLLGSSAAEQQTSPDIKAKIEELGRQDCHFVPLYTWDTGNAAAGLWALRYIARDNIRNIRAMLSAMAGTPVTLPTEALLEDLVPELTATVYDVQWVHRVATQLVGENGRHQVAYTEGEVRATLKAINDQDQAMAAAFGASAPYYSPLAIREMAADESSDGFHDTTPASTFNSTKSAHAKDSKKYDEYEKKLLPNLINAEDIRVTFDDIICPPDTKESLQALTSLSLTRPEAFLYGILAAERIPGVLLYGPPGTGKTMIAKAIAKQSGANMLDISAASINDMWVGNSEKNVRALFSLARKLSPTVIFLDEADAMLGARGARPSRSGHREVINQFLREWDGLTDMRAFIMVATNRPFDLDEAVLRRLPRRVLVDLPLRDARLSILRSLLKDEIVDSTVSLEEVAAQTELYSGSDLKNVCVAAALEAVKEEVRARDAHSGSGPYVFPDKRILSRRHLNKALREIGPSISEDMTSLRDIRKFDERYGDAGKKKSRRNMGFHVGTTDPGSGDVRIRQPVPE